MFDAYVIGLAAVAVALLTAVFRATRKRAEDGYRP
jgi:hypothetical protein